MRHSRVLVAAGCVAACSVLSGCATFFGASGGGPLDGSSAKELLTPAGTSAPDLADLKAKADALRKRKFGAIDVWGSSGTRRADSFMVGCHPIYVPVFAPFVPVPRYEMTMHMNGFARRLPCVRHNEFLFHGNPGKREFYAPKREWGAGFFIGDYLFSGSRCTAFETTTGRPVAVENLDVYVSMVGWVRNRVCYPADASGDEGLQVLADPSTDIAAAKYNVKECTLLLGGLIGWGRVNHRKYMQILFVPIPMGQADCVPADGAK